MYYPDDPEMQLLKWKHLYIHHHISVKDGNVLPLLIGAGSLRNSTYRLPIEMDNSSRDQILLFEL